MKEVKPTLHVKSLSKDMSQEFMLDREVAWFGAILDELQEDLDDGEMGVASDDAGIWFKGEATRRSNGKFGEVLFLKGVLSARFYTNCVRTGRLMLDELETDLSAVFVDVEMIERYQLKDETSIEMENTEYELYSYKDDVADIQKVLHEHIFLNKNPWPSLESESDE